MNHPVELIKQLIIAGIKTVKQNPDKGLVLEQINTKDEHSIEMDVLLEKTYIDLIKKSNINADVYSEEIGLVQLHQQPEYLISFDPLDGSTNYKRGYSSLLYGSLFAVYRTADPKFSSLVACGAVEYNSSNYWLYDGISTTDSQGKPVKIFQFEVTPSTPIYVDLHYRQNFARYTKVSKQLFIRNEGATIGNLKRVLNGVAGAIAMYKMKPEEVGAIVGLIKGAGGVVIDSLGNDVLSKSFDISKGYEIIAGDKTIASLIAQLIEPKGIDY